LFWLFWTWGVSWTVFPVEPWSSWSQGRLILVWKLLNTKGMWGNDKGTFFFFFCGTGVWTQGFVVRKQALSVVHFFLELFWRWAFQTVCLSWPQSVILPISASQVARITGMSHCAQL
jgi:hypothetical protein